MDLTNSITYDETYDDPESDIGRCFVAIFPTVPACTPISPHWKNASRLPPRRGLPVRDADTEVLGWLIRYHGKLIVRQPTATHLDADGGGIFRQLHLGPDGIDWRAQAFPMTLRVTLPDLAR